MTRKAKAVDSPEITLVGNPPVEVPVEATREPVREESKFSRQTLAEMEAGRRALAAKGK